MQNIRLVIFDLDGTLVDAYRAITKSFNYAMRELNCPAQSPSVIRRAVGWGDANLLKPFVRPSDLSRALKIYRRYHKSALLKYSHLLPGASRLLIYLKKRKVKLAVASNRPTQFSLILIRHLGLAKYFDYILCADKLKYGKPHPLILNKIMRKFSVNPEETLYVGDMAIDALAGRRAKVRTVVVCGGSSLITEIRKEKPWRITNKLTGLLRFGLTYDDI